MKKSKPAAAVIAAAFFCTGCSLFSPAESLLTPPKLSAEQAAVYDALADDVGTVTPVFPKSGENRSAYLFDDLDGNGINEAAVFYRSTDSGESAVRLNILTDDGAWHSVYDCAGGGISVDKVISSPIGSTGKKYIAAGYNLITPEDRILELYSYENGILNTVLSESYSDFAVADLTSDGNSELVIITGNTATRTAKAVMFTDSGNGVTAMSSVDLSASSESFENITFGKAAENINALYIDERNGSGDVFTEIVYSVGGHLRNPAAVEGSAAAEDTRRPEGYPSVDADGDGIIEIPVTEVCPGYENAAEKLYITNWCVLDDYNISRKYTGWYSNQKSWCLMFPGRWEGGLITVRIDSVTGAVIFCKYDGTVNASPELLRINAVRHADSETLAGDGWELIGSTGETDYMVKLADDTAEPLVLTLTEVKNNFFVLT